MRQTLDRLFPKKTIGGSQRRHLYGVAAGATHHLERWRLVSLRGWKLVVHRFNRGDDRELGTHNHPWHLWSVVVWGWYSEEVEIRQPGSAIGFHIFTRRRRWMSVQHNTPSFLHVVTDCNPGGCWTLAVLSPKDGRTWGFPGVDVQGGHYDYRRDAS